MPEFTVKLEHDADTETVHNQLAQRNQQLAALQTQSVLRGQDGSRTKMALVSCPAGSEAFVFQQQTL